MKFIDLKINKYFKLINFDETKGSFITYKLIKIVPVKNRKFDVFNRYNLTTHRYVFVNPETIVKEIANVYE